MYYLFDTNIALIYLREHKMKENIEQNYRPFSTGNLPILSVVSVGELKSIALRNQWGTKKIQKLELFIKEFLIADINSEDVLNQYAIIDAYSQGRLLGIPLGNSSRNMSKNDLWIAATANVTNATLITTDSDFDHLDDVYLNIIKIVVEA